MKKSNSITRVREIHNMSDKDQNQNYYEIYLTTYKEFINKTNRKIFGVSIEQYPYKWYNFQYVYEVPAFLLQLSLSKWLKKDKILVNKAITNTTRIFVIINEAVGIWNIIAQL